MSLKLPPCDHDECPRSRCNQPGSLDASDGSVESLDGYRAAFIAIDNLLDAAASKLPKRLGGREHLAAYREGYYNGLLLAHCQSAFGEFPEHNVTAIVMISSQNALHQATASETHR